MDNVKALKIVSILTMLISCGAKEDTSMIQMNPEQDIMIWDRNELPLKLAIDDNFSDNEVEHLKEMFSVWEQAANIQFVNEYYFIKPLNFNKLTDYYYKDPHFGIHKAKNFVDGLGHKVLASCQLYVDFNHKVNDINIFKISHGDIVLNEAYFDFSDGGGNGTFDIASVFLHELGHFIGLLDKSKTVMAPKMGTNDLQRNLDSETQDQVFEQYQKYNIKKRSPASIDYDLEYNHEYKGDNEFLINLYMLKKEGCNKVY